MKTYENIRKHEIMKSCWSLIILEEGPHCWLSLTRAKFPHGTCDKDKQANLATKGPDARTTGLYTLRHASTTRVAVLFWVAWFRAAWAIQTTNLPLPKPPVHKSFNSAWYLVRAGWKLQHFYQLLCGRNFDIEWYIGPSDIAILMGEVGGSANFHVISSKEQKMQISKPSVTRVAKHVFHNQHVSESITASTFSW